MYSDQAPDGLDGYRRIVRTHLVDILEDSLRTNGLSWTSPPDVESGYRVYRPATCLLSPDVAETLSRETVSAWVAVDFDGLVEHYARGGAEPDHLYFGVGPRPDGDRLSPDEFEHRLRAMADFHVEELGGSIAARLSTMIPTPVSEISRIEVVLRADGGTDVYVILDGESPLLSQILGLDALRVDEE